MHKPKLSKETGLKQKNKKEMVEAWYLKRSSQGLILIVPPSQIYHS